MNSTVETIQNRRSVRFYDSKEISKNDLQTIIEAGHSAPSGGNVRSWRFVVVENGSFKEKLKTLALPRYKKWMEGAPEMFVEMRKEIDSVASDPVYYDAAAIVFVIGSGMTCDLDSPMVCQNIMLAARSLDIGSCWVYFGQLPLDDLEVRDALEMKEGEKVFGPILLGYPSNGFPEAAPKNLPVIKWL